MKRSVLTPALALLALGAAPLADASPIRWEVADGGNGHFYDVIVGSAMTWDTARTGAKTIGPDWDLATITSAAESAFVKSLFNSNPGAFTIHVGSNCPGPWIGGFDVFGATNFQWVTGEAVSSTDWGPSEPFGNGDAVAYGDFSSPCGDGSGIAWNDFPAHTLRSDSPVAYVAEGLTISSGCQITDGDTDGEADATDRCLGTPAGADADDAGCSLDQFCERVNVSTKSGASACKRADWKNDEPLMKAKEADCRVDKRGKGRADDRCVPSSQS
jgi:hypothetical protein